MFLEEIKNHIKEIKKLQPHRFFKKVEEFNYNNFIKNLNDKKFVLETIDKIISGHVYILRSSVPKDFF